MRDLELNYFLRLYFSGKINDKLEYLKEKYEQPFSDDYYCSLNAVSWDRVGKNLTNKINDPTGGIAVKLADIKLNQQQNYEFYLKFYQVINKYIKKLDRFLVDNMKIYLGLIDSPLFKDEEKEIERQFEIIKSKFIQADILEEEKKTDPYQEFLEEEKQPESNLAADRYSLEEAQERVLMYR